VCRTFEQPPSLSVCLAPGNGFELAPIHAFARHEERISTLAHHPLEAAFLCYAQPDGIPSLLLAAGSTMCKPLLSRKNV